MSAATMSAVSPSVGAWITLAEAARITGRSTSSVKSIALAGGIRTRAVPGARILYNRSDAEKLSERHE